MTLSKNAKKSVLSYRDAKKMIVVEIRGGKLSMCQVRNRSVQTGAPLSNISMIEQLSLTIRLSLVCCSLGHMVVNTFRLAASQFSKINRPIFFYFKLYAALKFK